MEKKMEILNFGITRAKIDVLTSAKRLIIARGWNQGQMIDGRGRLCIMGAISESIGGAPLRLSHQIRAYFSERAEEIVRFNDHFPRTFGDILCWFDREIEKLGKKVPKAIPTAVVVQAAIMPNEAPKFIWDAEMPELPAYMINPIADIPLHV